MSSTAFFGNTPFQGKLKVYNTRPDNLIGFIEVTYQPDPYGGSHSDYKDPGEHGSNLGSAEGMHSNLLMYFKDYDYVSASFINFVVADETTLYNFNICFLRLPNDLNYMLLRENADVWEKKSIPINYRYQGITICNIHKADDPEPTPAKDCFVQPNYHLLTNAKCGCSKGISFGANRSPVFKHNNAYYILGINTDCTPCYFATTDWADIEYALNRINSTPPLVGQKLGFAHYGCYDYSTNDLTDNYGIHILKGGRSMPKTGYGWGIEYWAQKAY